MTRPGARFGALVLAITLAATTAAADGRTVIVTLANGTVLQGELVELVPNDHTTLRLATGEIRRVEASQMSGSDGDRPSLVVPFAALDSDFGPNGTLVHVEVDRLYGTFLYRAAPAGPDVGWLRVCEAPCNVPLDPDALYKVGGPRTSDSKPFHLRRVPRQTLFVDPGQPGSTALGVIFGVVGLGLTIPGVYLITRPTEKNEIGPDPHHLPGWILFGTGAPFVLISAIELLSGGTTVTTDDGSHVGALAPRALALGAGLSLGPDGVHF